MTAAGVQATSPFALCQSAGLTPIGKLAIATGNAVDLAVRLPLM